MTFRITLFLLIVMILVACNQANVVLTTPQVPSSTEVGYPLPLISPKAVLQHPLEVTNSPASAYPYPPSSPIELTPYPYEVTDVPVPAYLQTPVLIPTAGRDTGVVTGKIVNLENRKPMPFQTVYLGVKLFLTPAPGYTYHILEKTSPHAITDLNGTFAISDVTAGNFIVMVWSPFGAYVVMENGKELMANVEPGKVLDLGELEAIDPMNHTPSP